MSQKKVTIKQVRSGNRCPKEQRATLQALGLGRIGKTKEHTFDANLVGMLKAVSHLVIVDKGL